MLLVSSKILNFVNIILEIYQRKKYNIFLKKNGHPL